MPREIKITLYDIFGYLLPGAVLLTAIVILLWAVFFPRTPLSLLSQLTIGAWVLVLLLAYFSGHMAQALANLLEKFVPSNESLIVSKNLKDKLPEAVLQAVKSKASAILGADLQDISTEWLYRICDEV